MSHRTAEFAPVAPPSPADRNPWQTCRTWRAVVLACVLANAIFTFCILALLVFNFIRLELVLGANGRH